MATFEEMRAEIADDVDDTTGEYGDQIRRAILAAIRYCERDTYYFNETRDETFLTVTDQQWYDGNDNAQIPTLVRIQRAYINYNGQNLDLIRTTPDEIEVMSDTLSAKGKPTSWAYFGQRIRLYPVPDTAYTVRLQIGPYRLDPLVSNGDTNAWLTEAWDMVKAQAKHILNRDTLKNDADALKYLAVYEDQKAALKAETSSRNGTGQFRPTRF
jgi:hypothetical protein